MKTTISKQADAVRPLRTKLSDETAFEVWEFSRVCNEPGPNYGDAIVSDSDRTAICRVLATEPIWDYRSYTTQALSEAIELRDARARLIASAPTQAAEIAKLRAALTQIRRIGGNLPDESLTDRTGPNDAAGRGIMYCAARQIALTALKSAPTVPPPIIGAHSERT